MPRHPLLHFLWPAIRVVLVVHVNKWKMKMQVDDSEYEIQEMFLIRIS